MLAKLTLENYKSFRQSTTIDFTKTNYTILPQNVSENNVLKGVVFVGPNGSGKSTVLSAIKLLLDLLFKEKNIDFGLSTCLLSLSHEYKIEYEFYIKDDRIIYTFSNDLKNQIISENLLQNDELVFTRKGISATLYKDNEELVFDEKHINPKGLFLRTLYFNNQFVSNDVLSNLMEFLKNSSYINAAIADIQKYDGESEFVKHYFENTGEDEINKFLGRYDVDQRIEYTDKGMGATCSIKTSDKTVFYKRVGVNMPIPSMYESNGNRILVRVLSAYLPVLRTGGLLLIDEFSSGFHNDLEKLLIKHFMKTAVNSQLIFVSHSTNLLSNSILRPDQEYSVEFNGKKGSCITRFSSLQPRNSQNIEKMYNSGVFNGIPNYKDNYED